MSDAKHESSTLTEQIENQIRIMAPHQRARVTAKLLVSALELIKAQEQLLEMYARKDG